MYSRPVWSSSTLHSWYASHHVHSKLQPIFFYVVDDVVVCFFDCILPNLNIFISELNLFLSMHSFLFSFFLFSLLHFLIRACLFSAVAVCGEKISTDQTSVSFAWWVSTCCMFPYELYKLNTSPEYANVMLTGLG